MHDVFISLFRSLDSELPSSEARQRVYTEIIEPLDLIDPELLEQLSTEDEDFGEAVRNYRGVDDDA